MRTKKKGGEGMAMGDRMVPVVVAFLVYSIRYQVS